MIGRRPLAAVATCIVLLVLTNMLFAALEHLTIDLAEKQGMSQMTTLHSQKHTTHHPVQHYGFGGGNEDDGTQFHIVFSTGCTPFQDWQSYAFFYHAWKSGQSKYGNVTRVASGCDDDAAKALVKTHEREIQTMSDNFMLHLTPDYSNILPGVTYSFFNKPFGIRHWMEQKLRYAPHNISHPDDDTVFIILDPDMIILRPFTSRDMNQVAESWVTQGPRMVQRGQPFSQLYQFWSHFKENIDSNITHILSSIHAYDESKGLSNLYSWTSEEINNHYIAGPPYIATGKDMYELVKTYAEVAVPVYELTRAHLSEMYAYSVAAGHLRLKHQLAYSFMVSDIPGGHLEGFHPIEMQSDEDNCAIDRNTSRLLPHILHYCQVYSLGPYYFHKYRLPNNFLSCEHPLLAEPPPTIAEHYNTTILYGGEIALLDAVKRKRMTFMLCQMIGRLNQAVEHWKRQFCEPRTANFDRTYHFPLEQALL